MRHMRLRNDGPETVFTLITEGESSITSGGGNGRYAEMEKDAR